MGNRSLMDRTPDSDSGNAGSIPAGCIFTGGSAEYLLLRCFIEHKKSPRSVLILFG